MCMYVCMGICAYMHVHVHFDTSPVCYNMIFTVCMNVLCVFVHVHEYVHMYLFLCGCILRVEQAAPQHEFHGMCMYVCVFVHIHMYVRTHVCTYIMWVCPSCGIGRATAQIYCVYTLVCIHVCVHVHIDA
jgi:hypothetical protein